MKKNKTINISRKETKKSNKFAFKNERNTNI